nr:RES domain-containing protein [Loktanella sp. Alg231-35]
MPTTYAANPLSFGFGSSRFSPRHLPSRPTPPLGLIYGTVDVATGVFEAVIRDSFDIRPSRILRPANYNARSAVNFSTASGNALTLLDLTSGNAARFGVPSDVLRYSNHKSGQFFSEFVYAQMPDVDGILYTSRFTEALCVAIYDRGISKLTSGPGSTRLTRRLLAPVMAPWNVQVL